jgi:PEP-CTERM motif
MTRSGLSAWALAGLVGIGLCGTAAPARAIAITPTSNTTDIVAALTAGNSGLNILNITVDGNTTNGAGSTGTYTNASGTYGIGPGMVISSGNVSDYGDGPNTTGSKTTSYGTTPTPAEQSLLDLISGSATYFDVTTVTVQFSLDAGFDSVFFNVVFGSDEYPEFVNSTFIDAFGLFVNGTNVAFAGGQPINVNHPSFTGLGGTELDGVIAPGGNPVMTFGTLLANPQGVNTLTFIIADRGDPNYDSTAYISALGAQNPATVPEPASMFLLGTGLLGLAGRFGRPRHQQ